MVNNWFNPSLEVKEPSELFGWNKSEGLLKALVTGIISSKSNIQILGERRSGKSSILNCISYKITNNNENDHIIPIIVNFNDYNYFLNKDNGYNLFTSCILLTMNKIGLFNSESYQVNKRTKISKSVSIEGYLENLSTYSGLKSKKLFKELIHSLAEKNYSIVLLIDEYESMFLTTFNGEPGSLYGVRNLITQAVLPNSQIFQCCITGTRRWSDYYNTIGSDDFNFINDTAYLETLTENDSTQLIKYGLDKCNKDLPLLNFNNIYEFSGGWPFLIKLMCNHTIQNKIPDENYLNERCFSHFDSIWQRLSYDQKLVLKRKDRNDRNVIEYLLHLNLISKKSFLFKERILPLGKIWKNFVSQKIVDDINNLSNQNPEQITNNFILSEIADSTCDTINEIGRVLERKNLDPIFNTRRSPSYMKYASRLYSPSDNKESFKKFISVLYIIIFESTSRFTLKLPRNRNSESEFDSLINAIKDIIIKNDELQIFKHPDETFFIASDKYDYFTILKNDYDLEVTVSPYTLTMAAYPTQFNRYPYQDNCPDIFYVVNIMRHEWAEGHDTRSDTFVQNKGPSPADAQKMYLSHQNTPLGNEWFLLQKGILNDFNMVLNDILSWANDQNESSLVSSQIS